MNKTEGQPTDWKKILTNGLISKPHKQLIQLSLSLSLYIYIYMVYIYKPNNPIKKWVEDLNRHFFEIKRTSGQQVHEKMLSITNY